MGFLRKVGRTIKKGIKKLFSSKIGAFVGSIALSMIMGPVISRAFNGIKGVFTGAAQKGTETLVQDGVQKVVEEKAADVATKGIVDNTVTGAMEKVVTDNTLSNDLLLQAQEGLKGNLQEGLKSSVTETMNIAKDGSKLLKDLSTEELTTLATEKTLPIRELGKDQLAKLASDELTLGQNYTKSIREIGLGAREFVADPIGKTKSYLGDSFVPDAVESLGREYVMGALQGEPEESFQRGNIIPMPPLEASQGAYVQEIRTQVPNLQTTNFQQLNQSLLYGTLSPQYLMGQYQS
jgi:hypothetical protein